MEKVQGRDSVLKWLCKPQTVKSSLKMWRTALRATRVARFRDATHERPVFSTMDLVWRDVHASQCQWRVQLDCANGFGQLLDSTTDGPWTFLSWAKLTVGFFFFCLIGCLFFCLILCSFCLIGCSSAVPLPDRVPVLLVPETAGSHFPQVFPRTRLDKIYRHPTSQKDARRTPKNKRTLRHSFLWEKS